MAIIPPRTIQWYLNDIFCKGKCGWRPSSKSNDTVEFGRRIPLHVYDMRTGPIPRGSVAERH